MSVDLIKIIAILILFIFTTLLCKKLAKMIELEYYIISRVAQERCYFFLHN